jgi:hypothetical protein
MLASALRKHLTTRICGRSSTPRGSEPQARELFVQLLSDERWAIIAADTDNRAIGHAAAKEVHDAFLHRGGRCG